MMQLVVLHHTGVEAPHFDLMFERSNGGPLRTFRIGAWPIERDSELSATELADHRREYLEYQGPVAGNRGEVKRVAAGAADVHEATDRIRCSVTLAFPSAQTLTFEMQHSADAAWSIRRVD